jgi:hypothetical protein
MKRLLLFLVLLPLPMLSAHAQQNPPFGAPAGPPQAGRPPGGPFNHKVLSASSRDGLTWSRDEGVRLEHASVPCPVVAGDRVLLYYVDANRGPGLPESVGCAVSLDGLAFERQPFTIEGMRTRKAVDPGVVRDADGTFRLYYLASNATGDPAQEVQDHEIHLAVSQDGVRFRYEGVAFTYPGVVDPDVFFYKGTWFMYVFAGRGTAIATSPDGRRFTYKQMLDLPGWGTVAPILLDDGRLRLYAFNQRMQVSNAVRSFISANGIDWTVEPGDRIVGGPGEQITDPFVVRWKGGYRMYFKVEERTASMGPPPQPGGQPGRPGPGQAGPWDQDVLVHRVSKDGAADRLATFERSGVPTIARMKDGRLIAAHQHFPENDPDNFDKVAVRFSENEGRTWTPPQVIQVAGLPDGMRFPFDPTLVRLPDGRVRLYFTSLRGRTFQQDVPAIFSAISTDGVRYTVEPGVRFAVAGRPVVDCAVVLHKGVFHLFVPDNGTQLPRGRGGNPPDVQGPPPGTAYHATSGDGLQFAREDDVRISGNRRWLGSAQSDGEVITFFGSAAPGPPGMMRPPEPGRGAVGAGMPRGSIWRATSEGGVSWKLLDDWRGPGADPGAVSTKDGAWIVVSTGPPRPGTPSAQRGRRQ